MQRLFLHLKYLEKLITDPEGSEHVTIEDAKEEARGAIREIAAMHLRAKVNLTLWSIRIADEEGNMLAEVFTSDTLREVMPPAFLDVPAPNGPNRD